MQKKFEFEDIALKKIHFFEQNVKLFYRVCLWVNRMTGHWLLVGCRN